MTTEHKKRIDPQLDLSLGANVGAVGPVGLGGVGRLGEPAATSATLASGADTRMSSRAGSSRKSLARQGSRKLSKASTPKGGGHLSFAPPPEPASGLTMAALQEPGRVKLLRAPAYIDPSQRAKRNMMQAVESRQERQARQSERRQQMIESLTPQF